LDLMTKIYILPVDKKLQPIQQLLPDFVPHNDDYGVEQDFYSYILQNRHTVVSSPELADWHYLPIYWTRWHVNHDNGQTGLEELQRASKNTIIDDTKTFTICQYDDGPKVNLGATTIFLASRKTETGIDIPLLCKSHRKPLFPQRKKYLATFSGSVTHPIRQEMMDVLQDQENFFLFDGRMSSRRYVKNILSSRIALSPRGYGGSSYRFFEAMQLGRVPFLIGEPDTRPFKRFISWESCSLYCKQPSQINDIIDKLTESELNKMGKQAAQIYQEYLRYQVWCKSVIRELES
jgi:hypothetical protein